MAENSTSRSAADTASAAGIREDDEHESKETVLLKYFLQEWEVVKSILDRIVASGSVSDPADAQKIRTIVDKYQEQGHLLEPFLETIVCPLMFIMRSKAIQPDFNFDEIKPISIIIYSLVTVCGYKSVIRFFPHQVSDLELAVSVLERCHNATSTTSLRQESTGEMEMKCVVLLWLYILVLIPFDISSVDSSVLNTNGSSRPETSPLLLKMIWLSKDYLSNAGPMRRIAGLLLSRLLTRPDMLNDYKSFFQWAHEVLSSINDDDVDQFTLLGIVEALASIFMVGRRNILLSVASTIWSDISLLSKSRIASQSSLLRKLIMKLSQRIGLACLPHCIPSWQYQVKINHLDENVSLSTVTSHSCMLEHIERHYEVKEEMDTPDIIEEIIELLLSGLRDSDTVVRWSAAKGIGRITARLTSSLAEDVLSSILELFSPGEGDGSWHGGSLALAELARRGLLLPTSLPKVVPVIIKALHYDIRRGPHSVGSHVRDAAAYVCWAFGRAYSHTDMKMNLEQLAPHLLMVACYDREVNCRRAAAAAFQENVGRQGAFPHGIDIINAADYFSLASRTNSYLKVAVYVAQYKDYLYPFIDDLISHKIPHWDRSIRELAAKALSVLVKFDPHYFKEYAIGKLSPLTLSSDLSMRHGATLAVGELVLSLYQCGLVFSKDKQRAISGIVPAIEKARLYRGKGGEIMRSSVCRFIECMSLARIHLTEKTMRSLHETLNDNLKHPNPQIQHSSVDALKHFFPTYLTDVGDEVAKTIISKYLELLNDPNPAARRGSALAIGILPYEYLAPNRMDVISKLSNSCLIQEKFEDQDAETRVNAIRSLVSVCSTLSDLKNLDHANTEEESLLFQQIKGDVMQTLFKALDDYAVDNRGDVGSWVREAAMTGLERCTSIICQKDSFGLNVEAFNCCSITKFFDASIAACLVGALAKQAVEKLDKLREIASKTLQKILYQQHSETIIPHHDALVEIIPNDADLEWSVPSVCYPRFIKLLEFSCYRKPVLSGLVISLGGLQESLRKASSTALLAYIKGSESDAVEKRNAREYSLGVDLLWVLTFYQKSDRVIVPALKTTEFLLSRKVFLSSEAFTHDFCADVLQILTVELKGTKDFSKLLAGLSILGYIASVSDSINTSAFSLLLSFLGHRYPRIRRASADQVYLVILQNESFVSQDKIEAALEILTETCWESNVEEAKLHMSRLYAMAGMDLKASEKKLKDHSRCLFKDENMSYSSLVGFSGF